MTDYIWRQARRYQSARMALALLALALTAGGGIAETSGASARQTNLIREAGNWQNRKKKRRHNAAQRVQLTNGENGGLIFNYPHRRKGKTWGVMVYQKPLALRGGSLFIDLRFIEAPPAGGYFALAIGGVRAAGDSADQKQLELRIDPRQAKVTCGAIEKPYHPRPEDPLRMELAVQLGADRLRLVYGRKTLIDAPIEYIRPSDQVLQVAMNQTAVQVMRLIAETGDAAPPDVDYQPIVLAPSLQPLRSPFLAYFGTHYSGADDLGKRFTAVRGYGGTHVRLTPPPEDADVPERKGPFSGEPVRVRLEDYHSQSKFATNPKTGRELFDEIVQHGIRTVGVFPTGEAYEGEPFDRDFAYWFYRLAHEQAPQLNQYAVWQIGNEIVSVHWNPRRLDRKSVDRWWNADRSEWNGYDLKWKLDFYVNHWLGPEIEAIQAAARDVYGDSHAIPIATGSMNPYNAANTWFVERLMDARFDGERVPTLAGAPVWKHVDYLTIHYMLAPPRHANTQRLHQYVRDYLRTDKVKGLWITEEHGVSGRGAPTVLERGMYFLRWVATDDLNADQAKVFWYGEKTRAGRGSGANLMTRLGTFFADRAVRFAATDDAQAYYQVISARPNDDGAPDRVLVVILPRRGSELAAGTIDLRVRGLTGDWRGEGVDYSYTIEPPRFPVKVTATAQGLNLKCNRVLVNPTAIYLSRP